MENSKLILDADFFEDEILDLKKDEKVIWKGSPRKYFSITLLEIFGPYDSLSIITGYQIIGLILIYQKANGYIIAADYALLVPTILLGGLILLLPDFYKHYKKVNTEYFVTGERVLIKTTKFFQPRLTWIWKSDLSRVSYQEFKNKSGTLFFIPKQKLNIKTRDLPGYRRRHFPTFEVIDNVLGVHKLINDLYFTRVNN